MIRKDAVIENRIGGNHIFMTVGQRIRYFRVKNKMTQKSLGVAAGFSDKTAEIRICQYESGIRNPKKDVLLKIAQAMRIPADVLSEPDLHNREDLPRILFILEMEHGFRVNMENGTICLSLETGTDEETEEQLRKWKELRASYG